MPAANDVSVDGQRESATEILQQGWVWVKAGQIAETYRLGRKTKGQEGDPARIN